MYAVIGKRPWLSAIPAAESSADRMIGALVADALIGILASALPDGVLLLHEDDEDGHITGWETYRCALVRVPRDNPGHIKKQKRVPPVELTREMVKEIMDEARAGQLDWVRRYGVK